MCPSAKNNAPMMNTKFKTISARKQKIKPIRINDCGFLKPFLGAEKKEDTPIKTKNRLVRALRIIPPFRK